jgi:hypothetical protein
MEGGNEAMLWLKDSPKVRWVRKAGQREERGFVKGIFPNSSPSIR